MVGENCNACYDDDASAKANEPRSEAKCTRTSGKRSDHEQTNRGENDSDQSDRAVAVQPPVPLIWRERTTNQLCSPTIGRAIVPVRSHAADDDAGRGSVPAGSIHQTRSERPFRASNHRILLPLPLQYVLVAAEDDLDDVGRSPSEGGGVMLSATSTIRRTGVALALPAVILLLTGWLWNFQPTDGANIGAGALLWFAEALAVAGTVVLLCSLGRARRDDYDAARPRWTGGLDLAGKLGALLGVCYILFWVIQWFLISYFPIQLQIAGDATFVAAAALMSTSRT